MALHLLRDVRQIFRQRQAERLPSRDMVRELGRMENQPWSQWNHTKPITATQLARILADLGVAPKVIRHGQNEVHRGYRLQDILAVEHADSEQ
jgi:hypothetical protein